MCTTITSCQKSVLFKISNGICIYREESFVSPIQTKSSLNRPASPSLGGSWSIASIAGIAFSSIIFFFPIFSQPALGSFTYIVEPATSIVLPELSGLSTPPIGSRLPVRLKIPKINVDAALESVGLTSEGALAVPKGPTNAGWYNLGPRPGDTGAAVIDGHFGWWKNGTQAVFDNLNKLHNGDKLYIEDETGATTTFVVRESRKYDPNAEAAEVFGSSDGKAHLNLITCDGKWNSSQKSYSDRLVVFTDKETE